MLLVSFFNKNVTGRWQIELMPNKLQSKRNWDTCSSSIFYGKVENSCEIWDAMIFSENVVLLRVGKVLTYGYLKSTKVLYLLVFIKMLAWKGNFKRKLQQRKTCCYFTHVHFTHEQREKKASFRQQLCRCYAKQQGKDEGYYSTLIFQLSTNLEWK